MFHKTLISLLLAAALCLGCLAGCGSTDPKPDDTAPSATAAPAPDASATAAPQPEADDAQHAKYEAAFAKYAPDTVVMTVNGEDVTWAEYYSWLYYAMHQLESNYGIEDWAAPVSGLEGVIDEPSYGGYARSYAVTNCIQFAVLLQQAARQGTLLTPEQQDELEAMEAQFIEYYGGEEEFAAYLQEEFLSRDYFLEQNAAMAMAENLKDHLFGVNGADIPDADAISYVRDYGYMYAKHILFMTVDDTRAPLDDEAVAQKRADAEAVLAELNACAPEELAERFDALMWEWSEDTGLAGYPDGYYFLPGKMVAPFEEAVKALEENGLSDIVETAYGYHIIYCPPMSADHMIDYDNQYQPFNARMLAADGLFSNMMNEWFDAADVQIVPEFEALSLNDLLA